MSMTPKLFPNTYKNIFRYKETETEEMLEQLDDIQWSGKAWLGWWKTTWYVLLGNITEK